MNITRLNLAQSLPIIKSTIHKSHFLSFDLEMSGIQTQDLTTPSIVDSIQSRYEKQKQSVCKFIPLQFGLSAFQVLPNINKIIAYPFNFYIFPLTQTSQPMKFSFHAGTMNFLTKNQFDFNKLFYEGIPYTNKQKMRIFKAQNNLDLLRSQLMKLKSIQSPEIKAFIKIHMPIVQSWIFSQSQSIEIGISFIKVKAYMLLKQKIQQKYKNQSFIFTFDNQINVKRTKMIITKSRDHPPLQDKISNDKLETQSTLLFNDIFDQIVSSKKPLIVHNGFLDLMHIYYRFNEQLPNHWAEYKSNIHKMFPLLYDNKYLFANSPILNHMTQGKFTGLEDCFVAMRDLAKKEENLGIKESVKIEIDEIFKEYAIDSLQCHEAGFDSLMTGYSFLKGVNHLNNDINLLISQQAFNEQFALIKNRVPQGSIKVPFNFQQNDQDLYTKDGNSPIFFKAIFNQTLQESKILQYFTQNYGSVSVLWTRRDLKQFCIIFLNEQNKTKFQLYLLQNCTIGKSSILSIQNIEFLVFSAQKYRQSTNNSIKIEKQINQQ